ncbi:MAG: 4-(cytidine 5'-diphospho)-2-C-methyl-D-erythritol kinase [Candidatus Omnitrophota bacterium]
MKPSLLSVKSFAKVNLYLQILNKRQDKFHNLSTLFCRIDLADAITLRNRADNLIKIKCNHKFVPIDATNLCWRAVELLKEEKKINLGLDIELKKNIPVGAGLGGGSSNAAAVLWGLNKYWKLNLSLKRLATLGAKLGSDVAFFIYNTKFAIGSQRGDKIAPLPSLRKLKLWFVLIYPNLKVSTPLVYEKFDACLLADRHFSRLTPHLVQIQDGKKLEIKQGAGLTRKKCNVKMLTSELLEKGSRFERKYLINDLEIATTSLYPVINQVKKAFSDIGLEKIMMSGSGAAVFALCNNRKQAQDLGKKLSKAHKSWQVFATSAI